MRDTIQLLLFDPTVPEPEPKLAHTISFEGVSRRTRNAPRGADREAVAGTHQAVRAVIAFPSAPVPAQQTVQAHSAPKPAAGKLLTLPAHRGRDDRSSGPKAA
jgi:hypothetical protein